MPVPQGYTLDQQLDSGSGANLPPGYTLDQPAAQSKPESTLQTAWRYSGVPGLIDTGIGAVKGLNSTVWHGGDLIRRGEMGIAHALGVNTDTIPQHVRDFFGLDRVIQNPEVQAAITPTNPEQQAGKTAEQIGEYFLPGGAINTGTKAVEGVTAGMRGAAALNAAGRAALEAGSAGAVTAAQTGDPEQAASAAATAGGVSAGMKVAGAALPTATRLYQNALRPTGKLASRQAAVATGLREGIIPSEAAYNRVGDLIDDLNKQTADVVAKRAPAPSSVLSPSDVIQPQDVAVRADALKPTFAGQVNPESDVAAVDSAKAEFLRKHTPQTKAPTLYGPDNRPLPTAPPTPTPMTLPEAQAEKQATYRALSDKAYGELKGADTETQKALARGLKEEIVARIPELQPLNEREGALINLQKQLEKFVGRQGNNNAIGLRATIAGSALAAGGGAWTGKKEGAVKGGAAGAAGALLLSALGNPSVKAALAIAIDRGAEVGQAALRTAPKIAAGAESQPAPVPKMARGGIVRPRTKTRGKGIRPQVMPRMPNQMPTPPPAMQAPRPTSMPPMPTDERLMMPPQPMAKGGVISPAELVRGSADVPMDPEGIKDTDTLGKQFAKRGGIHQIVAGPLTRTRQTAAMLQKHNPQAQMSVNKSLAAWHLGGLEGQPRDKVKPIIENYIHKQPAAVPPGRAAISTGPGESFNTYTKGRLFPLLAQQMKVFLQHPNQIIVDVMHRGGINAVHGWAAKGFPPDFSVTAKHVTDEREYEPVYRLAPGKGGKWVLAPVDMKSSDRNKPGLYLLAHGTTAFNQKNPHESRAAELSSAMPPMPMPPRQPAMPMQPNV